MDAFLDRLRTRVQDQIEADMLEQRAQYSLSEIQDLVDFKMRELADKLFDMLEPHAKEK